MQQINTEEILALTEDEQFDRMQEAFRQYRNLEVLYTSAMREICTKFEILDHEFQVRFDRNPIHNIESRLKKPSSMLEKLKRKGRSLTLASLQENLTDIAGVRVICNYIEDIYQIALLLLRQSDVTLVRCTDYIRHPKENGYRSLHLVVKVPVFLSGGMEHIPVEIQIRTIAMDFWASLEHHLSYKAGERKMDEQLHAQLNQCAEEIARIDQKMQKLYQMGLVYEKDNTTESFRLFEDYLNKKLHYQ